MIFPSKVLNALNDYRSLGMQGDAHCGATVKNRSRVKQNPQQPNLRQVHLFHLEMIHELAANGF
jgi:hypothetical protein